MIGELFINHYAWTVTEIFEDGSSEVFPITNCYDWYGEECAPKDGIISVIVAGREGRWHTIPYDRFSKVQ